MFENLELLEEVHRIGLPNRVILASVEKEE